jgi:uncharacterized membrane protein HdeD (DUF308 family)
MTVNPKEDVMSQQAAGARFEGPPFPSLIRAKAREVTGYWWALLVAGIVWIIASLVILQFDDASVTTVGVLIGVLFLYAGVINVALASVPDGVRWVPALFAALFLIAAIVCFVNPADTFAGTADILGFLFLVVGIWWMVRAFLERPFNPTWWLGLISGVLMTGLAFWTAGQFFIEKAYVLLVFAGIWALMEGVVDIVRALQLRELHNELEPAER